MQTLCFDQPRRDEHYLTLTITFIGNVCSILKWYWSRIECMSTYKCCLALNIDEDDGDDGGGGKIANLIVLEFYVTDSLLLETFLMFVHRDGTNWNGSLNIIKRMKMLLGSDR